MKRIISELGSFVDGNFLTSYTSTHQNSAHIAASGARSSYSADSEEEQNLPVNLALELDYGEAATGAIGVHRIWAVATDDRTALGLFGKVAPRIELISTLEMVKYWTEDTVPSDDEIKEALEHRHVGAPYEPKSSNPLLRLVAQVY